MDSSRLPEQPLTQWQLRAALGPQTVGNSRSAADNISKQMPSSARVSTDRRRSNEQPSSSLKATVRGSSPWRRTPITPGQPSCTVAALFTLG
jgi:hypothetical protein